MRLDFKFRESAPPALRMDVVEKVKQFGAQRVEPLFPDDADGELASLYIAEGVPDEQGEEVVSTLDQIEDVEFAEPTPERRLIR